MEEIYQQSLEIELELRIISFHRPEELLVYYKGRLLEKRNIPDLFVYGHIVMELKAVSAITPEHEAQLVNYMRITCSPIGYVINFGLMGKLQYKRFILSEYLSVDLSRK